MRYIFTLALILASLSVDATTPDINKIKQQPLKVVAQKANELYNNSSYEEAYYYYKALSEMRKKLPIEDAYRLGKTAFAVKEYEESQNILAPLLPKAKRFPLLHYEYALALKYSGDYVLSTQYFQSYINLHQHESNNDYVKLAQTHLKTCQKALKEKENTSAWFLDDLDSNNTNNDLIYRAPTNPSKYKIGFIECQTSKGTCLKKVYPDGSITNLKGSVGNPILNSCSPHIAPDGVTVFFAQQEMGKTEYKIFSGTITPEGEIDNIQKLGSSINRDGYSSTHPSVGITNHGQVILYFASTLPGSRGGYDIWYSIQTTDGDFTMAYNLGTRINGEGDDVTPYYYQADGELYFSSEKPQGYGGLDVYKLTGEKKRWKENQAHHLEKPVNSTGNDFHYRKNAQNKGSFSTDRKKKEKTVKFKKVIGA